MKSTLSAATEQQLDALLEAQNGYRPNADITEQLRNMAITMLVGATCEGKSTAMHAVTGLDTRFGITGTFTSRPPRQDDEGLYTYYEHSDIGLKPILERIRNRQVVQYAVNPFTKQLYGSELSDYHAPYNLRDVFASAVASLRQLGFGRSKVVTIISEPEAWLRRFEERFPPDDVRRRPRRDEAIQSLEWSLAQPAGEHFWVENIERQPERAAQEIIALTFGTLPPSQTGARALGKASLLAARGIIV